MYTDGLGADVEFPNTKVPTKAPPTTAVNKAAAMAPLRSAVELLDATPGPGVAM